MKPDLTGQVVSEEKMFKECGDDDGLTTEPAYTISSAMSSGELKIQYLLITHDDTSNIPVIDIVHPRSLISTFVVRCLDSIIPLVSICKISSLLLVTEGQQAGVSLVWSETPKAGLLVTRLK